MQSTVNFSRTTSALLSLAIIGALTPQYVRAEADYEFAKTLMDMKSPSFSTDDLVARLAARLEEATGAKQEAKLIQAALKRRQSADLTVEKRVAALKEASDLYKEVVAGDKKFRLYDIAEKESDAIGLEITSALIEGAKDRPEEAKKYRAEAATLIEKKANAAKAEADAAEPIFKAAYKRFTEERAKLNPTDDTNKMPGRDVMDPLEKSFDAWIIADKRYVGYKVEQVEKMDDADTGRKKVVEEMAAHCKKRIEDDLLSDFVAVTSRYSYLQGRLYAAIGNDDEATKSWNDALNVETQGLPEDIKKQIYSIRKLIIHDLVKMKVRGKKYGDVEEIYIQAKTDPLSKSLMDEDAGKELIIDYSKALTALAETAPDYEKAVKELLWATNREKNVGSAWANTFARAIADVIMDARGKKIVPHLTAREWYIAARGFHLMGRYIYNQQYERLEKSTDPKEKAQAPAKFEEAYKEYSSAVDNYRRAIAEARQPDRTDLATRLEIEPLAWFEMGLSYMRMKHDYEAIIAYKAMRDSFLKDGRVKWLPDPKKEPKAYTKQVRDALDKLDLPKEKDGMLAKSGVNILIALDANEKAHKDPWNSSLKPKIISWQKDPLDPDSVTDQAYIVADGDAKGARSLVESAKTEAKADNAEVLWNQAMQKYISAAEKFGKVKPDSQAYDFALVQVANSYTQAGQIAGDGHSGKKDPKEADAFVKDLAQKALDGYAKYETYLVKNPSTDEKILARRKKFQSVLLLAKNSLYVSAGDWDKAIESADKYLAWETENPPEGGKSSAPIAYLNKFRAMLSKAAGASAPQSDPYLKGATDSLRDLRNVSTDNKLFVFMLNALSDRYNIAAFQLEKKKKTDPNMPKEDVEKLEELINTYENEVADLQSKRVDIIEVGSGDELALEDYSRLVYLFHKTGQIRKAADIASKLLKKFDPENKNMKLPDDEQTWDPILKAMQRVIHYESIDKDSRCKEEHRILVDYMYDTVAGVQLPEGDKRRPANDKYNENMEKALAKLESIRNPAGEFKDCQTLRVGAAPGAKPFLTVIEDEIQFRRKVVAARDLLSDMALEVAAQLKKEGNDEKSNEYLTVAKQQIEILKELKGEAVSIEIKVAEIDIALGNVNDAMNRLNQAKISVDPGSALYFMASRRIAELYALQKKWKDASEYPEFIAVTVGFNSKMVKERWPGMEEFLRTCYANGAPMPPAMKKRFEVEKNDAPKPEAPKTNAPEKTDQVKKEDEAPAKTAAPVAPEAPKAEPAKAGPVK